MIELIVYIVVVEVWKYVGNWKGYLSIQLLCKKFGAKRIRLHVKFWFYVPVVGWVSIYSCIDQHSMACLQKLVDSQLTVDWDVDQVSIKYRWRVLFNTGPWLPIVDMILQYYNSAVSPTIVLFGIPFPLPLLSSSKFFLLTGTSACCHLVKKQKKMNQMWLQSHRLDDFNSHRFAGLMVDVLGSWLSGPGSNLGWGHCVLGQDTTLTLPL